ncbi:LRRN4 C-terminal-like protein [Hypanus sabinus]|uniref:LRRN4 C-terminal-like protein n=1 Tax=Hypanus sabinus TaxID=79690 RepID=UPI0028C4D092|nr:LRRN4 C-terminal-like protein [Hypanus sabinus]
MAIAFRSGGMEAKLPGGSAVFLIFLCAGLASWKQVGSASLSPGSTDWPATSVQRPDPSQGRESSSAVTESRRTTRLRFVRFTLNQADYEDYGEEDYGDEPTTPSATLGPLPLCDYKPCRHLQVPCAELQRARPCLCVGMSGSDSPPSQPRMEQVTARWDHGASVRWCEPLSQVSSYRLVLWPKGSSANVTTRPIPSRHRLFTLDGLEAATTYTVCVLAFNPAGTSRLSQQDLEGASPGTGPCLVFSTSFTRQLILYLGIAVCVLVVLSVLCVLLRCFCAKTQRSPAPSSLALGLRNPTYEHDKGGPQAS